MSFVCGVTILTTMFTGCQIDGGLNLGPVPNHESIYDTFRGIIRSEATTNIERMY